MKNTKTRETTVTKEKQQQQLPEKVGTLGIVTDWIKELELSFEPEGQHCQTERNTLLLLKMSLTNVDSY